MKRKRFGAIAPLGRAIGVVAAVGIITTGVTFAVLQSQTAALTGNTIQSATAALQVSKDGGTYDTTFTGYDFKGIIPGGPAVPTAYGGYPLWLKNTGTAPLFVRIAIPHEPTYTPGIDLSKVSVVLTPYDSRGTAGTAQSFTLAALISANATGGLAVGATPLANGSAPVMYGLQVSMASDAFNGQSISIQSLDLIFTGVVTN
jgi:hypothetical protein